MTLLVKVSIGLGIIKKSALF